MSREITVFLETKKTEIIAEIKRAAGGVENYSELPDKPKINGVELVGDLTTEDLHIKIPDVSGFATKEELLGKADKSDIPTKTSQLTNDKGYITSSSLNGYATTEYVNNAINSSLSGISNALDAINGEIV